MQSAGVSAERCVVITFDHEWDGNYAANFSSQSEIPFKGLDVLFTFDHPVKSVSVSTRHHTEHINASTVQDLFCAEYQFLHLIHSFMYTFQNWGGSAEVIDDTHVRMYNDNLFVETGAYCTFGFQVSYSGDTRPEVIAIDMNGQDACGKCGVFTTFYQTQNK